VQQLGRWFCERDVAGVTPHALLSNSFRYVIYTLLAAIRQYNVVPETNEVTASYKICS